MMRWLRRRRWLQERRLRKLSWLSAEDVPWLLLREKLAENEFVEPGSTPPIPPGR